MKQTLRLYYIAVEVDPLSNTHSIIDESVMSEQRRFRIARRTLQQHYDYRNITCWQAQIRNERRTRTPQYRVP